MRSRAALAGTQPVWMFLLVTQMLPEMLVLIPIYGIYRSLALLNNLTSLAVIDVAFILPICIWILKASSTPSPRIWTPPWWMAAPN